MSEIKLSRFINSFPERTMMPFRFFPTRTFCTLLLFALVQISRPASAQLTITCAGTGSSAPTSGAAAIDCRLPVDSGAIQTRMIRVRVMGANEQTVVRFRASSGMIFPDSTILNGIGEVSTIWTRAEASTPAVIIAEARPVTGGPSAFTAIRLEPAAKTIQRYELRYHSGADQVGFEKMPERYPMVVEIVKRGAGYGKALQDTAKCRAARVRFTNISGAGTITPTDSVVPDISPSYDRLGSLTYLIRPRKRAQAEIDHAQLRCLAFGNRTYGEGAGERWTQAEIVGPNAAPTLATWRFRSVAHALPRLITGFGTRYMGSYWRKETADDRAGKIERTLPDGSKVTIDTTFPGTASAKHVDGGFESAAIAAVTTPILVKRIGVTLGVDPRSPDEQWYAGLSLLNFIGPVGEAFPLGIHGLLHLQRTSVLDRPTACESHQEDCTSHKKTRVGAALLLTVDASDVIAGVIKKLSGG